MAGTQLCEEKPIEVMVLLVDDQAMVGEAVRRMLAGEPDIDFHFCADPDQAVLVAERIQPTVVLQDLIMPGVDGLELVRQYRGIPSLRDVPIIVLSTKEDAKVKREAFSSGANDYLVKLPDPIELVARIRYHSRAYMAMKQRDAANRALRESQQQLLEANIVLQRLMKSDGLTGLANRRHFDEFLTIEWRNAHRMQSELSLIMMDVDYFKRYNDHFGHAMGDDVLRRVAQTLEQSCVRAKDLAARYGGEEFAMILPDTSPGGAHLLAEKVRQAIEGLGIPHAAPSSGATVTLSIGVATLIPQEGQEARLLIEQADRALYRAKANGRNRVER